MAAGAVSFRMPTVVVPSTTPIVSRLRSSPRDACLRYIMTRVPSRKNGSEKSTSSSRFQVGVVMPHTMSSSCEATRCNRSAGVTSKSSRRTGRPTSFSAASRNSWSRSTEKPSNVPAAIFWAKGAALALVPARNTPSSAIRSRTPAPAGSGIHDSSSAGTSDAIKTVARPLMVAHPQITVASGTGSHRRPRRFDGPQAITVSIITGANRHASFERQHRPLFVPFRITSSSQRRCREGGQHRPDRTQHLGHGLADQIQIADSIDPHGRRTEFPVGQQILENAAGIRQGYENDAPHVRNISSRTGFSGSLCFGSPAASASAIAYRDPRLIPRKRRSLLSRMPRSTRRPAEPSKVSFACVTACRIQ